MNTNEIEIWKERFADRKSKGLTVKDWCLENGLTRAKYFHTGIRLLLSPNQLQLLLKKQFLLKLKFQKKQLLVMVLKLASMT